MKKQSKILAILMILVFTLGLLSACAKDEKKTGTDSANVAVEDAKMEYIGVDDVKENLDADKYLIVDLRKADDYKAGHIPGAIPADLDVIVSGKDFEKGKEVIKTAVEGKDKPIVLVCYSGKKYAQAGTNVLKALDHDMSKVFTLEGGMKAWTEKYADAIEK